MGPDRELELPTGRLILRGAHGADEALAELVQTEERSFLGPFTIRGPVRDSVVFAKASALSPRSGRRHKWRKRLLRAEFPRVQEYENLRWLNARLFQAPHAYSAGVLWRDGLPRYQAILMERMEGVASFEEAWAEADGAERNRLLTELGAEVGRMHALRFVHRDLFPRNLLVAAPEAHRRLIFLDGWRAAPGLSLRGPGYDLACLFLEGAESWDEDQQATLWNAYLESREEQGRPAGSGLLVSAQRAREGLLRRLRREPARLRGGAMPGPWTWAGPA